MNFKKKKELTTEEIMKDMVYDPKNFSLINLNEIYENEVIFNGIVVSRVKNSHKMKKKFTKNSKK